MCNYSQVNLRPHCLAFEPEGDFLDVGFTSGIVKFVNTRNFEDMASFAPSTSPIVTIIFSKSSKFAAAYDTSNHVILFGRTKDAKDTSLVASIVDLPEGKRKTNFEYIGRIHSHSASIVGIAFGFVDATEALISTGKDR